MQVQPITDNSFGAKNTFLKKAKSAKTINEKKYFKSLHYEAKSRMHYLKFQKIEEKMAEDDSIGNIITLMFKWAREKIMSVSHEIDAFHTCPDRFYYADNQTANPHRFYKVNK